MTIRAGDKIPFIDLWVMGKNGPQTITTSEIFTDRCVVLFALPGAYTPTCSVAHLPGFVALHKELKAAGVDQIACLSVNDAYVMDAWGKAQSVDDEILMLADGNGEFTHAVGLEIDRRASGMGTRSQRYAMIVNDGIVSHISVEKPGAFDISDAKSILDKLL